MTDPRRVQELEPLVVLWAEMWRASWRFGVAWQRLFLPHLYVVPWPSRAECAILKVEARGLCHVISADFSR